MPGPLELPDPFLGGGQLAVELAQLDVEVRLDGTSIKDSAPPDGLGDVP
jgi:hypothetical protein